MDQGQALSARDPAEAPDALLSQPPPRPIGPIAAGGAFLLALGGAAGSAGGLAAFLWLLAFSVLPGMHGPVLGDSSATASVLGCLAGAAGFVGSWIISSTATRSLVLYRKGVFAMGRIERLNSTTEEDPPRLTIHWHLRDRSGRLHVLRSTLPLPRGRDLPSQPCKGDPVAALYPEGRPAAAQPVGLLDLRRDWHIAPEIQPPRGFTTVRIASALAVALLLGTAFTGLTANRTLDPGFLRPWTWIVVGGAALVCLPGWLLLRRYGPWLRGQAWVWLMGLFLAACIGGMGLAAGANVWLPQDPPVIVRTRVLNMDDEYFPGWHRAAYVRSWRQGRVKERIPLHWRMGLGIFPGDDVVVEVRPGALGWPFVGRVRGR